MIMHPRKTHPITKYSFYESAILKKMEVKYGIDILHFYCFLRDSCALISFDAEC